ncbi:MAG: hypothetical protein HY013_17380 [Candidatus Solibacter usitatus]|nr:hypothetical protein [Candidatus Solibacter usitatus]
MLFDPASYGPAVAQLLSLDGAGCRLMPLASGVCSSPEARARIDALPDEQIFPGARAPVAARAGLYLYFSCLDQAHAVAQDLETTEGSYWHAILHRQEPDPANSGYWFRRVGDHTLFHALREEAGQIAARHPAAGLALPSRWDPYRFIEICEEARRKPGSPMEQAALEIQLAEWQLLFDYCAREVRR